MSFEVRSIGCSSLLPETFPSQEGAPPERSTNGITSTPRKWGLCFFQYGGRPTQLLSSETAPKDSSTGRW